MLIIMYFGIKLLLFYLFQSRRIPWIRTTSRQDSIARVSILIPNLLLLYFCSYSILSSLFSYSVSHTRIPFHHLTFTLTLILTLTLTLLVTLIVTQGKKSQSLWSAV